MTSNPSVSHSSSGFDALNSQTLNQSEDGPSINEPKPTLQAPAPDSTALCELFTKQLSNRSSELSKLLNSAIAAEVTKELEKADHWSEWVSASRSIISF